MNKRSNEISVNIQAMFDSIAREYDFLNNLISFFTHKFIKKEAIAKLDIVSNSSILDLCCGSGDMSGIIKNICPNCKVTGVDFSLNMLKIAKDKYKNIDFQYGNAVNLQFKDNEFDNVVMAFGLRNIPDKTAALNEIYRVLKPGGSFMHIDFGEKNFASWIFDVVAIIFAKIFSKKFKAYEYLIESKKNFPPPGKLINTFRRYGFKSVQRFDFLFGVISCQIAKK